MQIALTQKLAQDLKVKVQPASEEIDPLFVWTANWTKAWSNSRSNDLLVLVNNATRFAVVVYEFKRKDLKKFNQIVLDAISNSLLDLNIQSDMVDMYMEALGEIEWVKNSDRKATSWLNQAAREVTAEIDHKYNGLAGPVFDNRLGNFLNKGIVNSTKSFKDAFKPYEKMMSALKGLTYKDPFNYTALELEISLDLEIYQASRRIILPDQFSFGTLHDIIQRIFGWKNYHLHTFMSFNDRKKFEDDQILADVFTDYQELIYIYDFGDDWIHKIKLVRQIPNYDQESPYLLEAKGKTPPEDVGGVDGFIEFHNIMQDPSHPEYEEARQWSDNWKSELYDWETKPGLIYL